ncbi:MAG: hypothetical protein SFU56_14150 [Capsulimonadales bacterium]|nr:hypothetical protein [Capsulimonadales bacterium]
MNELIFRTGGSWETTTLFNRGMEVNTAQLFVDLRAGRDEWGDPIRGGIFEGADLTAIVRPAEDPYSPWDVLPGRLMMQFPGYELILENYHPAVYLDHTRVFMNGENITDRVIDLYVDINAVDDVVSAYVTVYKSHFFRRDEVITHNII